MSILAFMVTEHERGFNPYEDSFFYLSQWGRQRDSVGVPGFGSRILRSPAMVLLVEGDGFFSGADRRRQRVGPGDAFLLPAGAPHAYGPVRGGCWHEVFLVFDGALVEALRGSGALPPFEAVLPLGNPGYWAGRILAVALPELRPAVRRSREEAVRFHRLMVDVVAALERDLEASRPPWLERARTLLSGEGGMRRDPRQVARMMGLGYETFRKGFRRHEGLPPAKYRERHRMLRAAELLTLPGATVAGVAEALHFADAFHFSKAFKRVHGLSPRDFRGRGTFGG